MPNCENPSDEALELPGDVDRIPDGFVNSAKEKRLILHYQPTHKKQQQDHHHNWNTEILKSLKSMSITGALCLVNFPNMHSTVYTNQISDKRSNFSLYQISFKKD